MRNLTGRVVRPNVFARRSLAKIQLQLRCTPPNDWSQHLFSAWQMVNDQLHLSESEALSVILDSVSAAHRCLVAENQRVNQIEERQALKKVRIACQRVLERIKDATPEVSAKLRRRLDEEILPLIQQPVIDLEVIQAIFEAAAGVFDEFSIRGPSLPKLLREAREFYFPNLSATLRPKLEQSIADLRDLGKSKAQHRVTAVALFAALTEILFGEKTPKIKSWTHQLRSQYVAEVAEIWSRAGLNPSRAHDHEDAGYRSRFHRFTEFILCAIQEPQARRHDGNIDCLMRELRAHSLPEEIRQVGRGLRRVDHQWLISDDHVRTALKREIIERDSI